ncbi:hypothetical protein A2348_01575 [Candidatus Uhrbacteria bacterium RIFOXYB12_FULL_58_10]|nr:MAG: hypothetical protein A2348_01575 [Candidatus Uhrbacteria bacterium RIFOXYB12_FULL_58_10]OGL99692.1 MAG: hypothetical protein A2501_00440 [Candidatus Uhrbacteria bacterium RIFOXYC12_FULL_57_11]
MFTFEKTKYSGTGKTRSAITFVKAHTLALNVVSLALVFTAAASYIVQVNGSVAKGYAIRELEDQINDLTLANQKLEVTVREAQSLENVNRSVKMLGLVAAETPTYINASVSSVALAR